MIGTTLKSRYKIIKALGSGGFGDTYLATDLDLPGHPACVVKQLKSRSMKPEVLPIVRRLFETEAQVLYNLGNDCDRIPRLFAHFEEDSEFFLVQEFIDGHDLTCELIPKQRWGEAEVTHLLQEILEVLVFVHQRNVIHRDLKPPNIMRRRRDSKLILIDFGAVKEVGTIAVNTKGEITSTIAIGTPGYLPSEQASGHPKLCSDIYAVGIIGIQALTGLSPELIPIDSDTLELAWQNQSSVGGTYLADVISTMVRYNFNQRFPSAIEALQALQQTIVIPKVTPNPSPIPVLIPWKKLVIAGAVTATVGVTISLKMLNSYQSRQNFASNPDPSLTPSPTPSLSSSFPSPSPTPTFSKSIAPLPLPTRSRETINFPDRRRYTGEVLDGKADGSGIMNYPKGDRYEGEFKNGLPNGRGSVFYINGRRYEGEIKDNVLTGRGVMIYPNGDRYEGEFKEDVPNGTGVFTYVTGARYQGDFRNGKANGYGTYLYVNGDQFKGEYVDDQPNGKGIYIYASGDRQEGVWKDGKYLNDSKGGAGGTSGNGTK